MKKTIILLAVFALLLNSYTSKAGCHKDDDENSPYCESGPGSVYNTWTWDMLGTTSTYGLNLYMGAYGGGAYASANWTSNGLTNCYYNGTATNTIYDYYVVDGSITLTSYAGTTSAFIAASW